MNLDIAIILVMIFIGVTGFAAGYSMGVAHGEKYSYNMTDDELKESFLLDVCIELHIEAPACSMIWGGIDTNNGETIK